MKHERTKKRTFRVDVYSIPKDSDTCIRCFMDIPESKASDLLIYLMTHGKPVTKGDVKIKKRY